MTQPAPWTVGDDEDHWYGYLIPPDHLVLRNLVGATTAEALEAAENDLLEYRLAELREHPELVPRSYDLDHLCGLHRQLFQDVYAWAGELRTVGLAKGEGDSFMPPHGIGRPVADAAARIVETELLRRVPAAKLPAEIASLYDFLNFGHPFREGNGRTQREFFAQLLAESGRGLAWDRIEMRELHSACDFARNRGDLSYLREIFEKILTGQPSY
ncbi:Fic/DOC family protein [Microlunatus speluncae]|uniref:Fic/DOC family protein n=1 Tax=Microlunatus speluncae TaxID=2594267 RepID=UPI0014782930|nr:Fic family protein [Microlunatus speluncae]